MAWFDAMLRGFANERCSGRPLDLSGENLGMNKNRDSVRINRMVILVICNRAEFASPRLR
jgi:hypothetical protein